MRTTPGMLGIEQTDYRPGDMVCLNCYRSWSEDITPSGRCPWEYEHGTDSPEDTRKRMIHVETTDWLH